MMVNMERNRLPLNPTFKAGKQFIPLKYRGEPEYISRIIKYE